MFLETMKNWEVTELDFVSFRYSPDDRYDTRSNIQTTMSYSVY